MVDKVMLPCEHGRFDNGHCACGQGMSRKFARDEHGGECLGGRVVEIDYGTMSQRAEGLGIPHSAADLESLIAAALGVSDD